jgi:phospholipid transport system substrate-binding protein
MTSKLIHHYRKLRGLAIALALLGLGMQIAAAEGVETAAALSMLEQIKGQMLTALQSPSVREDTSSLRTIVDQVLVPRIDFRAASQLILGAHWKAATSQQRDAFMREFREFLVRFYSSAMTGYITGAMVPENFMTFDATPLRESSNQLTLRSHVWPPSGASIPVDYRLYKSDSWRVIDVSVGGISLARNYRAGFDSTINASGLDELIADLAAKNASPQP